MKVVAPPTAEPVSLAEVKDQLGIDAADTDRDAVIGRRISQARQWAEDYTRRAFMPQTLELRFDYFPCEIELVRPPIVAVSAVEYIDSNGVLQTVAASAYELDSYPLLPCIRPLYGTSWPSGVRGQHNDARARYTAGYGVTAVGAAKTITAITKAAPGVLSVTGHGYNDGDLVQLDVEGMTELDGALYRVYAKTADNFQLANLTNSRGISTIGFGTFTAGTVTKVQTSIPPILIDGICLLVGHWTNFQNRLEGEGFITRVPLAIQQMFSSERVVTF